MTEYRLYVPDETDREASCLGYGIALYVNGKCTRIIDDISLDRDQVKNLTDLFNEEDLDPVHFSQAVENFLYDGQI